MISFFVFRCKGAAWIVAEGTARVYVKSVNGEQDQSIYLTGRWGLF